MDQASLYEGSQMDRMPINSPPPEDRHKDYNRYKYYGKLRTGILKALNQ